MKEISEGCKNCELLLLFNDYLEKRTEEMRTALAPENLDSWDPYFLGFRLGVETGLKISSDLIFSYMEWARRGDYQPEPRVPEGSL